MRLCAEPGGGGAGRDAGPGQPGSGPPAQPRQAPPHKHGGPAVLAKT